MTDVLADMFGLAGRVAIVTGGASGIGKATARLLAAAGARVAIADRDADGAARVADEIGGIAVAFDLADEASIVPMVEAVATRWGGIDILINNAGIYPRFALTTATVADWNRLQSVNVWGCFVVMRAATTVMRRGGRGGRIVNISSIGGARTAIDDQILYNASKAALDSMTRSAALEFAADGILVNSVLPGAVLALEPAPRPAGHVAASGPLATAGRIPLDRYADANEIAGPILMLASAAGGYITGQMLIVDGGFSVS